MSKKLPDHKTLTDEGEAVYYIGLQDDENEYVATCGCIITRDGESRYPQGCDVAWFACKTHEHAEALRTEAESLLTWFEGTKDANNLARIHSSGLDRLREILEKMK